MWTMLVCHMKDVHTPCNAVLFDSAPFAGCQGRAHVMQPPTAAELPAVSSVACNTLSELLPAQSGTIARQEDRISVPIT